MQLLFCGSGWRSIVGMIAERLAPEHEIRPWDRSAPLEECLTHIDVLLPSNAPITEAHLASAPHVRLIQQPAAGTDAIDLAAASRRGIPVCNAPGANHTSVAEAALLLMLSLARRAPLAAAAFERGEVGGPLGMELRGRSLAIIGMGRSGRALAEIAIGLGMAVLPLRSSDSRSDLLIALGRADVVSLHCPLTPETRGLIEAEALAAMRPGALLINCARGPIIDRAAMVAALDSGYLGGVGLDVLWREPWDPSDPLFARSDVVTLPHIAGSTVESFGRVVDIVIANVDRVASGEKFLHRVN